MARAGRKPKWNAGKTELIRVPEVFVQKILAYTQKLDDGYTFEELIDIDPAEFRRRVTKIIDTLEIIVPSESTVDKLEQRINEVNQLKQQHRESQRLIREKDAEILALREKIKLLSEDFPVK